MREAARFLETLSDILDAIVEDAGAPDDLLLQAALRDLETLHLADPSADYELTEGDVFWRERPLAGTIDWPWRERLRNAGVDRMAPPDDAVAFGEWLQTLGKRLTGTPEPVDAPTEEETIPLRQQPTPAAPEAVALTGNQSPSAPDVSPPVDDQNAYVWAPPAGTFSLDEETERAWWLHGEASNRGRVPRRESEELVERLSRVLNRGPATAKGRSLEVFDELTTLHVINVSLLAMGLARHLAFDEDQVRALGLAGLYHDVGRVRAAEQDHGRDPTSEARRTVIENHPETGARVLMDSGAWFAVAAVAAYEHHLTWRGTGGYPPLHFSRAPHQFSRIISVCDTYDALRTERKHRAALTDEAATEYLRMLAGKTLDPEIVNGFVSFASEPMTCLVHPRTRPEASLGDMRWLPDNGFDPDFEPRPVSL